MTSLEKADIEAAELERPSLEALYRRHAGWLAAVLRRRFDPQIAEDIVQEAYIALSPYQAQGRVERPQSLLLRIAENLAYNQSRGVRRARARVERLAELSRCHETFTDAEQHQALLLKQVLEDLPESLRDTFMLSRHAGMSYAEISAHMGAPIKTVEARMSRALSMISQRMRD
ncbi:RNA polymerase sigma factor [Phenylobacterium sp.]|jgi:RNA polymerase sigma-70 factor (ECF subfamily)|uniref:RNA polymerase sigma factor n=1 Tax=Phenylobacterium sp. TaxID=1871053 RepID=UPI0035B3CD5B